MMDNKIMDLDFQALDKFLSDGKAFSVFCHVNADGDAIGALLALRRIINTHYGRGDVRLLSRDGVPDSLTFLPGADQIVDAARAPDPRGDSVILVDCGSASRIGDEFAESLKKAVAVAVIDHHATNAGLGAPNLTDPDASSTCEIIYRFTQEMGISVDEQIATCLYAGIIYDTGRFLHKNTTGEVFRACTDLVARGARPSEIAENVFNARSLTHLKMLGYALMNMKTFDDDAIARVVIERKIYDELGATDEDSDGIIAKLGAYKKCEAFVLITEAANGETRVSARSKGRVNVRLVCEKLGGGGHDLASGLRSDDPLEVVAEQVISGVRAQLNKPAGDN